MEQMQHRIIMPEHTTEYAVEYRQDIQPVLDRNAQLREASRSRKFGAEIEHLASIPNVLYMEWRKKYGFSYPPTAEDKEKILQLVRRPEYAFLRTTERSI